MAVHMNTSNAWPRLKDLGVLRIAGADARAFLQGQLSNDIERLGDSGSLLAALNTAHGRVVAVLRLITRPEGILAILPASLIPLTIERLRKHVLRSKVELSDESARLAVAGLVDTATPAIINGKERTALLGHAVADEFSMHKLPGSVVRHLIVGPPHAVEAATTKMAGAFATSERWRLAAIAAGEPQVYLPTSDLFVAQMLNLDLVDGLSFTKGCYTGQEIIARTQHRGRIKRRMLRYRLHEPATLAAGDTVAVDHRTGRIIECAALDGTAGEILVVLPLEESIRTQENPAVPDLSAQRLPLPYSIPDLL
jgi:hypothetical protein